MYLLRGQFFIIILMKSFVVSAIALAAAAQAQNLFELIEPMNSNKAVSDYIDPVSQSVYKNKFGCLVEESLFEHPYVEKTISAPLTPFERDYAQQEAFLNE